MITKEKRVDREKKGASARWDKSIPKAIYGSNVSPLVIGDIKIPCYILSDGRRVLVETSMAGAIGFSNTGGQRIKKFTATKTLSSIINSSLLEKLNNPIKFRLPKGGFANGLEATLLIDLCDAILEARCRSYSSLSEYHTSIAKRCEILVRGFATVGIIALIDEVTGYQKSRAKDALAKILEEFIASELRPWIKTFNDDFYEELCRLWEIKWPIDGNYPSYVGNLINLIVYKRLAPGVLEELKKVTPEGHQKLTENKGYISLREHLAIVIILMKESYSREEFLNKLNRHKPLLEIKYAYH